MIGVIATFSVKSGMEDEFVKHAKALGTQVIANEPDCYLYDLFKSKEDGVYIFMEKYKDKAALAAHSQTPYFLAAQPILGGCLANAPDIKLYKTV